MKKITIGIIVFCSLLTIISCEKDFGDLNKNPYYPTETSVGPLFNTVVSSLRLGWDEQMYVHNEVLYKQTQLAALTSEAWSNLSIGTENIWGGYYSALAHIRDIERRLEEMEDPERPDSLNNVRGMIKIILAYRTFRVADLFGDMPFFDAGRGFEGTEYLRPKFDTQEDIYLYLLDELKWASENMSTQTETPSGGTYYSIAAYDHLFGGNIDRWIKFANSLRLRHAMRISDKKPELAAEIILDIVENNLPVITPGEDVLMTPADQGWIKYSSGWAFREHKHLRMGSNIWNQMADSDTNDGSGFFDRRAFIFFETNNENKWVAYPQIPDANTPPAGGIPYQEHRDLNYSIKGDDNIYSPLNYYLIKDENTIPEIILTGQEYHFIMAEAYFRGIGLPFDEEMGMDEYFVGVIASMEFWDNIHANSSMWVYMDPHYGPSTPNPYNVANLIYMLETLEERMDLMYAQRWIDLFRQPWEAFSVTRRSGRTPREGDPLNYFRLPYPPSEVENNPTNWQVQSAKMGGDLNTVKVWWMN
nr:SusD/RagB family nutrient-binding outer membrane lipoprotein [Bacteroidota bacterium]